MIVENSPASAFAASPKSLRCKDRATFTNPISIGASPSRPITAAKAALIDPEYGHRHRDGQQKLQRRSPGGTPSHGLNARPGCALAGKLPPPRFRLQAWQLAPSTRLPTRQENDFHCFRTANTYRSLLRQANSNVLGKRETCCHLQTLEDSYRNRAGSTTAFQRAAGGLQYQAPAGRADFLKGINPP